MAVDIQKLFNEEIPARLAQHADAAKAIGGKFQITVSGEGGGDWYIDVSDSGPKAEVGNPGTAECSIGITAEDFQTLLSSPGAGMQLFFSGKLKVTGNTMLAMKLQKLFDLGK